MILSSQLFGVLLIFFGLLNPVWAKSKTTVSLPIFDQGCEFILDGEMQTALIKRAKQSPVELYSVMYHRYVESLNSSAPGNFRAEDLFSEDFSVLSDRLVYAKKYFEEIRNEHSLEITKGLLLRAQRMQEQGYGYLEFYEFGNAVTKIVSWVINLRVSQQDNWTSYPSLEKPIRSKRWNLEDKVALEEVEQYLKRDKPRAETIERAVYSYYQFPYFALPTVSETSRTDIALISSAPFWMRKWSGSLETVDSRINERPRENLDHERGHALRLRISAKLTHRFKNWNEFYTFLQQRESVTRHIIGRIESVEDAATQLRLDQILFASIHEENFGSIEYFSANYREVFRPINRDSNISRDFLIPNAFLSDEDQEFLNRSAKGKGLFYSGREYKRLQALLRNWYIEGNGPEYIPPPKPDGVWKTIFKIMGEASK